MLRNNRGQILTLVEILVVVLIIVGAGLYVARNYTGSGGGADGTRPASPVEYAESVDCRNNLQQIRYAINMAHETSGQFPGSLEELESSGITAKMRDCPVSSQPYSYDATTGQVWCTTPGHDKY